jgi:hypothetical protein
VGLPSRERHSAAEADLSKLVQIINYKLLIVNRKSLKLGRVKGETMRETAGFDIFLKNSWHHVITSYVRPRWRDLCSGNVSAFGVADREIESRQGIGWLFIKTSSRMCV